MRVLVTGGAGYIGAVVTEELIRMGHVATVVDDLSKGHAKAVAAPIELLRFNISDELLPKLLVERSIEAVIHMAGSSLVGESVSRPADYYHNNVVTTLALLNSMRIAGVGKLVFSSSAAVYGDPANSPIEETDPTEPTNPYGETKLVIERALRWHEKAYGLRYVSLRYFNAAGATDRSGEWHEPESHIIPLVLQAAAGIRPVIELFGDDYPTRDGTCIRDYIHVIDLAYAHVLALSALGDRSSIYNLGCGGNGYSVREVIESANRVTGTQIRTRICPRRAGDPAVLIASSSKIKTELGWKPNHQDLDHIIESAWRWLKAHPTGYSPEDSDED